MIKICPEHLLQREEMFLLSFNCQFYARICIPCVTQLPLNVLVTCWFNMGITLYFSSSSSDVTRFASDFAALWYFWIRQLMNRKQWHQTN